MAGNVPVETQSTEPSASQNEVDFLAQPPFGTNATAIADKQHPRARNRMLASTGLHARMLVQIVPVMGALLFCP
jgi:hypothetical protein